VSVHSIGPATWQAKIASQSFVEIHAVT
jgi:hypothetical protein